jgi:hypothetical protein
VLALASKRAPAVQPTMIVKNVALTGAESERDSMSIYRCTKNRWPSRDFGRELGEIIEP